MAIHERASSGRREPLFVQSRVTRGRANIERSIAEGNFALFDETRTPSISPEPTNTPQNRKGKRAVLAVKSISSSGSEDGNAEPGSGDEDDDEESTGSDPDFIAPSRATRLREAGPMNATSTWVLKQTTHGVNPANGAGGEAEDDDAYSALDLESDPEDLDEDTFDLASIDEQERQYIGENDFQYFITTDNLSAFGVGGVSDILDDRSSFSGESMESFVEQQRHVHFDVAAPNRGLLAGSESPLLTRALLPSALPDSTATQSLPLTIESGIATADWANSNPQNGLSGFEDDGYDSDQTVEDLPPEALNACPSVLRRVEAEDLSESPPSSPEKKRHKLRGPPRGIFEVEKDHVFGISDPDGKKLVFYPASGPDCPPWLARMTDVANGAAESAPVSPARLLDEVDESEISSQPDGDLMLPDANMDLMITGFTSQEGTVNEQGQIIGRPEAFYPITDDGDFSGFFIDPDNEGDIHCDWGNFIDSGDEDSDEETSIAIDPHTPTAPKFTPLGNDFSHLTNGNVTSFRNAADPAMRAITNAASLTPFHRPTTSMFQIPTFHTPTSSHKRARSTDSPYEDAHYDGVTPVRRVMGTPKKRKIITT